MFTNIYEITSLGVKPMSIFKDVNYKRSLPTGVESKDMFDSCNIAQLYTNTEICPGKTGLTFKGCNLLNCAVPGDSIITDCLTVQKSFCSHLNPNFGLSPVCVENCQHVVDTDEIWIDNILVDTIYHYKDTII